MIRAHGLRGLAHACLLLAACTRVTDAPPAAKETPVRRTTGEVLGGPALELSPSAAERLGITLAEVVRRPVHRTRVLAGELQVRPSSRAELRAPHASVVSLGASLAPEAALGGPLAVEAGEVLFSLRPVLSPEGERAAALQELQRLQIESQLRLARAQNEGALGRGRARLAAALRAFERAAALATAQAGSQRAQDEAQAELDAARAEVEAAERQRDVLADQPTVAEPDGPGCARIEAPFRGELTELGVAEGQLVPAGTRLGVLESRDPLWIRVPVPAAALDDLAGPTARLVGPDGRVTPESPEVRAIAGLPSADAARETIDRWFEVANPTGRLRPGQRVQVELVAGGEEPRLIVPWSALVFDAQGGGWVYEHLGDGRYRRAAVELERALGEEALLLHGPEPGSQVVRVGAAELFGTEFGAGK